MLGFHREAFPKPWPWRVPPKLAEDATAQGRISSGRRMGCCHCSNQPAATLVEGVLKLGPTKVPRFPSLHCHESGAYEFEVGLEAPVKSDFRFRRFSLSGRFGRFLACVLVRAS